ncbi:hypothetical protein GCM10010387_31330 [Streptomyces inusitatus]|uniref:Uncharacterized protein n=1 Tax=Streptomyces inusitatus TaxID=68221 RepID=A0A918Q7G8_9ACTN|nr:hypothetical protein GCM10010387_31330 [Streptomyces inusitatus]
MRLRALKGMREGGSRASMESGGPLHRPTPVTTALVVYVSSTAAERAGAALEPGDRNRFPLRRDRTAARPKQCRWRPLTAVDTGTDGRKRPYGADEGLTEGIPGDISGKDIEVPDRDEIADTQGIRG